MYRTVQTLGFYGEAFVFLLSLAVGLATILVLRRCWKWKRGFDTGDGVRKLQREPVLRLGGISLYAVFALSFLFARNPDPEMDSLFGLPFFLLGTTMFLLGFADDLFGLPALPRLLIQIGVGVAAYLCGLRIDTVTHPLDQSSVDIGGFALVLTVAWFVALPNLINLVDGMDGLAGGIALFLCLTLATLGAVSGHAELLTLNVALAGGIVAFLAFNLPPARIYMGDGGAYLLGFLIAGASLFSSNKGSVFGSLLVVVIVLGFPILDTGLAMLRRGFSGLPLMRPDALHLHHRLQTLGFSKRNILFILYGIFAGLSLLGLSVFLSAGYTLPIVGMVATIGALQGLRFLGMPHNVAEAKATFREVIAARKDVRYAYAMSQVLEHDLERDEDEETFWGHLRDFLARLGIVPLPGGGRAVLDGGKKTIVLQLDEQTLWALRCRRPDGEGRRWERVARCFVPAIMGARERWGGGLPPALGFVEVESAEALAALTDSLRRDSAESASAETARLGIETPAG